MPGTEKPLEKVTVMVSPARREPPALEVKPAVQLARSLAARDVLSTVTAVGAVAATMVTEVAVAAAVSLLVLRVGATRPVVLPLTMPAIVTELAVLTGRVQVPPLSASVTVATVRLPVTVAEQLRKPLPRVAVVTLAALKPAV